MVVDVVYLWNHRRSDCWDDGIRSAVVGIRWVGRIDARCGGVDSSNRRHDVDEDVRTHFANGMPIVTLQAIELVQMELAEACAELSSERTIRSAIHSMMCHIEDDVLARTFEALSMSFVKVAMLRGNKVDFLKGCARAQGFLCGSAATYRILVEQERLYREEGRIE